jgi:type IV pilus assembly protein PilM
MSLLSGVSDFFGLDIGTSAIRLVQLRGNGPTKALVRYAYVLVDSKIAMSDSSIDQQKLAQVIKELVDKSGVNTINAAVGLPSQRVFVTVADMDHLSSSELAKTIRYQADSLIPTPIDESKVDWAILGDSPQDKSKIEVLLASVTNKYIEQRLDLLESIGLNIIAFEPDSLSLVRALAAPENMMAEMVLDIGAKATDLVITLNGAPHLTRSIAGGSDAIVHSAMQNLNIEDKQQAEQFVYKFGLTHQKLEGQVYQAIIGTVDQLINEIEKSIKFFTTRYTDAKLERIIVTGGASTLPEFPLYIANKFGMNVEIGNAWRNVSFMPDRQNELLSISNSFSIAVGLAERTA